MATRGFCTSSATLTISSNPMKAKKASNEAPATPAQGTAPVVGNNCAGATPSPGAITRPQKMTKPSPSNSSTVIPAATVTDCAIPHQASSPMATTMPTISGASGWPVSPDR